MNRHNSRSMPLFLLALLLPVLLNGCAGMRHHIEQPRVSISDIQVHEVKALETVFQLELRIMNPNDVPLDIRGISCDLEIDGHHFASGLSNEQRSIPAYGAGTVPVQVYASTMGMMTSLLQAIQGVDSGATAEPIEYSLSGKVRLGGNVPEHTVPFEAHGTLSPGELNSGKGI